MFRFIDTANLTLLERLVPDNGTKLIRSANEQL
jgi:hypothetical protein